MAIQLAPRLNSALRAKLDEVTNASKILSKKQIQGYVERFKKKFDPEALLALQGEDLLDAMHKHNTKDSLVYWLEFKDDEEFPNRAFGAMRGGSALKFNIYWSPDTESWYKRSTEGHHYEKQEIDTSEAIRIAISHRDQLIASAERMQELSDIPTQVDYDQLQTSLAEIAPDIYNLAWGHKYLSLLFPTKLDDFQTLDFKAHYQTRLMLEHGELEGRYSYAYPFVDLSHQFDLYVSQFTSLLGQYFGSPRSYWRIGAGEDGDPQLQWESMKEGKYIALGWNDTGNLSEFIVSKPTREQLHQVLASAVGNMDPKRRGRWVKAFLNFLWNMKEGDIVAVSDGSEILGIGEIVDPYVFVEGNDSFAHRRPVKWLSLVPTVVDSLSEQPRFPFFPLNKQSNQIAIESHLLHNSSIEASIDLATSPGIMPKPVHLGEVLHKVEKNIYNNLEEKGQVVLYGPPGTGKTYWALRTAQSVLAWKRYGKHYTELEDAEKSSIDCGDDERIKGITLCTFHPSYNYEDFIEGYKPTKSDTGNLFFELKPGLFKRVCLAAQQSPEQEYFLVIDEINRGDVPRIFGELLTLLEKDKRSKPTKLSYSDQTMTIPSNLYIIGTMNTADQSIVHLDTALRRRFRFLEFMPDRKVLDNASVQDIKLGAILDSLNTRIREYLGNDGRNRQIGHAYFMRNGKAVESPKLFSDIIEYEIVPLLMNYCYGDFPLLAKILGSRIVDSNSQRILPDIFGVSGYSELPSVLLGEAYQPSFENEFTAENAEDNEEVIDDDQEQ